MMMVGCAFSAGLFAGRFVLALVTTQLLWARIRPNYGMILPVSRVHRQNVGAGVGTGSGRGWRVSTVSETLLERPAAAIPSPRSRQRRRDSHDETRGAHAYITGNGRGCSPNTYRPDLVGAKVSGLVTPMPSPFAVSCYNFQRGV